jgi:transcriptional regulator with XRE-family HTH domain
MAISLKAARVNAGLSRPVVIKRLNDEHGIKISVNTLANYENKAKAQPDINTGKALASIYGMSVDDIIFL